MKRRPVDIARSIGMSTSTLRHYEEWGIVPPVPRSTTGYRLYTDEHVAYFTCIGVMVPAFGLPLTSRAMQLLQKRDTDGALWLLNEACVELQKEKAIIDRTISMLQAAEEPVEVVVKSLDRTEEASESLRQMFQEKVQTIGEVECETGVHATAIRYWEQIGLLRLPRDGDNGYRLFFRRHVRQVLMVRVLRDAHFPLDTIRQVLEEVERNDVAQAMRIAARSLEKMNRKIRIRLRAYAALSVLCDQLGFLPREVSSPV